MPALQMPQKPPKLEPQSGLDELPEDVAALHLRLAGLEDETKLWSGYIKELSALEDPAQGRFFAAELHEARQYRMLLRYRKDFCLARIKRLNGMM